MLNRKAMKYAEHLDRDLSATQDMSKLVDGTVVIEVIEDGKAKVKVSETIPANTAVVGGIMNAPYIIPVAATAKEEYVVDEDQLIVKLRNENLVTGTILVLIDGVAATVSEVFATAPTAAGEVSVDLATGRMEFHDDDKNKKAVVTYTYKLTMEQAKMRFHQGFYPNQDLYATLRKVSVFKGYVELMTSEYDTSANWAAGGKLTVGANGKITLGGAGPEIPGGKILTIPDYTQTAQGAMLHFSAMIP